MDKEELKDAYKIEHEAMQKFVAKNAAILDEIVEDSGDLMETYEQMVKEEKKQLGI